MAVSCGHIFYVISSEVERSRWLLSSARYALGANSYFLYILSNGRRAALYIGMTNNLERRVTEYKTQTVEGFTKQYNCNELLYFEETSSAEDAIMREKQCKKWSRAKKIALIQSHNPELRDLSAEFTLNSFRGSR